MTYKMMKIVNTNNFKQQAGFSMLEVLITVFVLSIGLLGVAAMQATSIKLSHEAHLRSQASLLAYDIADRMRANPTSAIANAYDGDYTGTSSLDTGCRNAGAGGACNTGRITTLDLNNWDFKLGQTFPGVLARIRTAVTQGQTIATITLVWIDTDEDEAVTDNNAVNNRTFTLRSVI